MKVALCLTGIWRTGYECLQKIYEHIVKVYDADVFIRTYTDCFLIDNSHREYLVKHNDNKVQYTQIHNILGKNLKKLDIVEYDENRYKIPNYIETSNIPLFRLGWYFTNIGYNINSVKEHEKNNNFVYDFVILTRPDIMVFSDLIINRNYMNNIIFAGYHHFIKINNDIRWMSNIVNGNINNKNYEFNDQFYVGNTNLFSVFLNGIHLGIIQMYKNPEMIIRKMFLDANINVIKDTNLIKYCLNGYKYNYNNEPCNICNKKIENTYFVLWYDRKYYHYDCVVKTF